MAESVAAPSSGCSNVGTRFTDGEKEKIKRCEDENKFGLKFKAIYESGLKSAEARKVEIVHQLSTSDGDDMRKLQKELQQLEERINHCNSVIQQCEEMIQRGKMTITDIRQGAEERQRKEDSKRLFEEAMKDGHVQLNIINMLLSGVAGSGKTSLKHLLTNQPPPQQRNSTGCMEKPVRVNIRSVTSSRIKTTSRGWNEVTQDKLLELLSQIIAKYPMKRPSESVGHRVTKALQKMVLSKDSSLAFSENSVAKQNDFKSADEFSTKNTLSVIVDETITNLVDEVAKTLKAVENEKTPRKTGDELPNKQGGELFDSTWVYVTDCGGQPQFHDISPLFIRHIAVAAIVFRLTDDFSSFPVDEYYKDDQLVGLPRASHMTLEETLRSLIRSLESHCSMEKKPSFMFVGTFLDKLVSMPSVQLERKNKAILDMLSTSTRDQIVYNKNLKHPILALNTVSRKDDAISLADEIRSAIQECAPLEIKMPIWWSFLDIILQHLCIKLDRRVLSRQECLTLATRFQFDSKDLDAALFFFDQVCIAHYYPAILPDVVFIDAQIPLDKISELTTYAISLRSTDSDSAVIKGKFKRMAEGIITLEFLQLDRFSKHYVEGVFSPEDMLLIMKELLVISPIPLVDKSDSPHSEAEFFMPSLLDSISPAELEHHRTLSNSISPIAVCFPSGCIRSGVFCCLVVHLIKEAKWQVLLPSGEPVLLAKNCVKFRLSGRPCTITLIDSFSYIEMIVNSPRKELCPVIRDHVLEGIKAACDVLHYNNDVPQLSILCPCDLSATKVHLAEISDSEYWICSLQADKWGHLPAECRVWLGKSMECREKLFPFESLKLVTGVNDRFLDTEIKEIDCYKLGRFFNSVPGFLQKLNLTSAECNDVDRTTDKEGTQAGVAHALSLWRRVNPSKATFRNVVEIVMDLRRMDIATEICKYINH